MRAALLEKGSTKLEVVDDLEIRPPLPGEILVKVAYCGLCHSDLSVVQAGIGEEAPIVLGHEAAGVVVEVGPGVACVEVGDKVVPTTLPSCGKCRPCVSGHPAACVRNSAVGVSTPLADGTSGFTRRGREVLRGLGVSGFAEYTLATPDSLTAIPPDTPLDIASLLGCAVRTGSARC